MKSVMRQKFEEWYGFEVCDDMDIQTEVAWGNWKVAWKAAMEHAKEKANDEFKRLAPNVEGNAPGAARGSKHE